MVEGESGILNICPPNERPTYRAAYRRLEWPNGARTLIFTADEPERLRGKQHMRLWADELAAWRYPEAWDQAMFGLRLGDDPRAVVTTTPKPTEVVRRLVSDPTTHVTRGSTYDNRGNLAPAFFEQIIRRYEGTRIGRQELLAEILDDVEGALWTRKMIDDHRVKDHPDLVRVGIGVDPSGGDSDGHDEQGIVVVGWGVDGEGYVLGDRSCKLSPDGWGRRVVAAYQEFSADMVYVEKNFGGDMAIATINTAATAMGAFLPVTAVTASRGKAVRAEPVAALYEQGRMHHVGTFNELEDQLCLAAGTSIRTVDGDVPIEWLRPGEKILTRRGYRNVVWVAQTGVRQTMWLHTTHGSIRCTPTHPVYVEGRGFIPASEVHSGDKIPTWRGNRFDRSSNSEMNATSLTTLGTIEHLDPEDIDSITEISGSLFTDQSRKVGTFTIGTTTKETTLSEISSLLRLLNISVHMEHEVQRSSRLTSEAASGVMSGPDESLSSDIASHAAQSSGLQVCGQCSVNEHAVVVSIGSKGAIEPVYNLEVDGDHEYYANGLLVHNCNWVPGMSGVSPDRLDALVWAVSEVMFDRPLGIWSL